VHCRITPVFYVLMAWLHSLCTKLIKCQAKKGIWISFEVQDLDAQVNLLPEKGIFFKNYLPTNHGFGEKQS